MMAVFAGALVAFIAYFVGEARGYDSGYRSCQAILDRLLSPWDGVERRRS